MHPPASAGHGLNLQDGGNTLVFFGHNWNLEERLGENDVLKVMTDEEFKLKYEGI